MNGNYVLDALVREPRQAPEVVLETLMTVWTGTLVELHAGESS